MLVALTAGHLHSTYTTSYASPLHQSYVGPAVKQILAPQTYISPVHQAYASSQSYYTPVVNQHYLTPSAKQFVAPVHQSYVVPQTYVAPTYVAPQTYYTPTVKQVHQTYVTPVAKPVYTSYSAPIYQNQHFHQIQYEPSTFIAAGSNTYLPTEPQREAPLLPLAPTAEAPVQGNNQEYQMNESSDNNDSEVIKTRKAKKE